MPFTLPDPLRSADKQALVLAFGMLSVLEVCATVGGVKKVEVPCERICVLDLQPSSIRSITKLAGIHKFAPLMAEFHGDQASVEELVSKIAAEVDTLQRFALSGYDVPEERHEEITRLLLDAIRRAGFRKVKLLRPKGNELLAEQVSSREALDLVVFPYKGGYGLGPTCWVSDTASVKERGLAKPVPHSEIAMSPRLAQLLVNLSGLAPGKTLLDPFCGSGTILAEGLFKSLVCVGVDSDAGRIRDARKNLGWARSRAGRGTFSLKLGDARELPSLLGRSSVDGVVTEPLLLPTFESRPSTKVANELMETAGETYAEALSSIAETLTPGARVVMVVPVVRTIEDDEVSIALDGGRLGLRPFQPGAFRFQYPVLLSFESTRWIRRAVYVFESRG
ncbi:MAG: hypothetical protein LYZ66_06565 [Nitrososphaerales archaeon]|nr:hypothetical protein [Nitrososphaerales archaeon]